MQLNTENYRTRYLESLYAYFISHSTQRKKRSTHTKKIYIHLNTNAYNLIKSNICKVFSLQNMVIIVDKHFKRINLVKNQLVSGLNYMLWLLHGFVNIPCYAD